ncbi:MAG TPA: hypothetical protein VIK91_24110, partial [Nannocystis sp.]
MLQRHLPGYDKSLDFAKVHPGYADARRRRRPVRRRRGQLVVVSPSRPRANALRRTCPRGQITPHPRRPRRDRGHLGGPARPDVRSVR